MKVVILGAAGIQAQGIMRDLCTSPEVTEVVLADLERFKPVLEQRSSDWGENKTSVKIFDATDGDSLRGVIRGSTVCANSIGHMFTLQIMAACYDEGCHYTDMGGLFHFYRKQVLEHDKWKAKGLTAVLGMGSAPGITNVLARVAADQLDTIEYLYLRDGIANYAKSDFPLTLPYSTVSLLQEFHDPCYIFENGDWKEKPAFSQPEVVHFPDPVGKMTCFSTIHSEEASVPESFKSKGIQHMSFKLGLPGNFEPNLRFLAQLGFGKTEPIDVKGMKISPRDFFIALGETFPKATGKPQDYKCLRVDGKGIKDGVETVVQADVMCSPCEEWNMKTGPYSVGVPVGIVCRMLGKGEIEGPGCMPSERCVPTDLFLKYLAERNMHSTLKITKPIA
jgi:saccharopine dehydrogenase-like NADP-dependent oxidoreductase